MYKKRLLEVLNIILYDRHNIITHWAREMHYIGGNVRNNSQYMMKDAAEHILTISMDEDM